MAHDKTGIAKANEYAVRTDTWWSLLEKLWPLIAFIFTGASIVASAIYKVFGFVSQFGWGGWVLALIPSILVAGLLVAFFDWIMHVKRVRRLREEQLAPAAATGANSEGGEPSMTEDRVKLLALEMIRQAEKDSYILRKAQVLADTVEAKERYSLIMVHIESITKAIPEWPKACPHLDLTEHSKLWRRYFMYEISPAEIKFSTARQDLRKDGFSLDGLNEVQQEEKARITADAVYLQLLPEDEQYMWRTGTEKRDFYLRMAPLLAEVNYFRKMAGELHRKSNFLRNLRHA